MGWMALESPRQISYELNETLSATDFLDPCLLPTPTSGLLTEMLNYDRQTTTPTPTLPPTQVINSDASQWRTQDKNRTM